MDNIQVFSNQEAEEVKKPVAQVEEKETKEVEATAETEDQTDETDESVADGDETKEESEDQPKPKKLGGFKKKIAKYEARLSTTEQELEYWKQKALGSETKTETKVEVKAEGKPVQDDYESSADYFEALADWKVEQRLKQDAAKREQDEVKTKVSEKQQSFQSKVNEFKKSQEDYDSAIEEFLEENGDLKLSVALESLIVDSDLGPAAIYELVKNPDELERLNSLTPLAAAKEFGKLEDKLANKKKVEIKTKTTAAAPIKPVTTKQASVKKTVYDADLSFSEWEKLRNAELKAQKRA